MSRSSIFSFESLEGFKPRVPAALLGCLGIITCLELAVRLIPDERLVPDRIQTEVRYMEDVLLPRFERPRVVVLGSSRIRRAVVPAQLDAELGLPRNSTVNAGMAMGRIYDALYFYQRNRKLLGRADVVIFNFDEWHFSTGGRWGTHYELHAPWAERLGFAGAIRSRLVLDGLFSMRIKLPLAPRKLMTDWGLRPPSRFQLAINDDNQILPPERVVPEDGLQLERLHRQMDLLYDRFEISPVLQDHVAQLAGMVQADGARFVLMQLPNRATYQAEVEQHHGAEYRAHVQAARDIAARLQAPLHLYQVPADCGLTENSYVDYGHISEAGSHDFTRFLAELIKREGYLRP